MGVDINKGLCFWKITASSVKNGLKRQRVGGVKQEIQIADCVLR